MIFAKSLTVFVALALASFVAARHAFSVDIVPQKKMLTGPAALRATLLKHGRYVPPELEAAAKDPSILIKRYMEACTPAELAELKKHPGSTTAYPVGDDVFFYAPITVGKSELDLAIDTGSSDLWVFSNRLPKNVTKGHNLYNTSTGTKLKDYTWKIEYSDFTKVRGIVYRDRVEAGNATATSQAIGVATSISPQHPSVKHGDGILGLGFESMNSFKPKKQPVFWQNLRRKIFGVDFKYRANGTIDFGFIDSSKFIGPITYTPIKPAKFWSFNFTEYELNGTARPVNPGSQRYPTGILDTGTAQLYINYPAAKEYYKTVKGAKPVSAQWLFPCLSELGTFGLKIGGRNFYVNQEYLKQPISRYLCSGAIQSHFGIGKQYDDGDIIGDPLIVSNYLVFDGEQKRLGFARKHLDLKSNSN